MNKATDYERLLAGLPGAPEGERRGLMRLLADAADGARLPNRAAGWRWLADNHRWPRECEWPQGSDLVGWARFGWGASLPGWGADAPGACSVHRMAPWPTTLKLMASHACRDRRSLPPAPAVV